MAEGQIAKLGAEIEALKQGMVTFAYIVTALQIFISCVLIYIWNKHRGSTHMHSWEVALVVVFSLLTAGWWSVPIFIVNTVYHHLREKHYHWIFIFRTQALVCGLIGLASSLVGLALLLSSYSLTKIFGA